MATHNELNDKNATEAQSRALFDKSEQIPDWVSGEKIGIGRLVPFAVDKGGYSGALTMNADIERGFVFTATGNVAIAISNLRSNEVGIFVFKATNLGNYTLTDPLNTSWGELPTFQTAGTDIFAYVTFDGGASFDAFTIESKVA